ncbi:MAG: hypothetical protein V4591_06885, partial [Bdellovibrionota bacterium]
MFASCVPCCPGLSILGKKAAPSKVKSTFKEQATTEECKNLTPEELVSVFDKFIFNSAYSYSKVCSSAIPVVFEVVSELIQNNEHDEIKSIVEYIQYLHKQISEESNQNIAFKTEAGKQGPDYIKKCLASLYVLSQYIATFYAVTFDDQDNIKSCTQPDVTLDDLKSCFEQTKRLRDIERGITKGTSPSEEELNCKKLALKKSDEKNKKNIQLMQGGVEERSFWQRVFSRESFGILSYAIGNEIPGFIPDISTSGSAQFGELLVCDAIMMYGFSAMVSNDSGIGNRRRLPRMLLGDIYKKLVAQDSKKTKSQEKELGKLSNSTKRQLKELLPSSCNLTPLQESTTSSNGEFFTSADAEEFWKKYIDGPKISYKDIKTALNSETSGNEEKRDVYLECLRTKVLEPQTGWGKSTKHGWVTVFDLIFAKMNFNDQKDIIKDLGEKPGEIFGQQVPTHLEYLKVKQLPEKLEKDEKDEKHQGAIQLVYDKIIKTEWDDRVEGTKAMSDLLLSIYTSNLKMEDKQFLIEEMILAELEGRDRGAFAAGKKKRGSQTRAGIIAGLYTLGGVAAFILTSIFPPSKLALLIAKVGGSAIAATTFGVLGHAPNMGESNSHASKVSAAKKGLQFIKLSAEVATDNQKPLVRIRDCGKRACIRIQKLFVKQPEIKIEQIVIGGIAAEPPKSPSNCSTVSSSHLSDSESSTTQTVDTFPASNETFELKENTPIPEAYKKFQENLVALKQLKKAKKDDDYADKMQLIAKNMKAFAEYFNSKGIAKFVFEANHAEKNCPLFEITQAFLDKKVLKKMGVASNSSVTEKMRNYVDDIISIIYKADNEARIHNVLGKDLDYNNITHEIFNAYMSNGYKDAKSPKNKFLFSLQCGALLKEIENTKSEHYNNCKAIFIEAVKNASTDKGSYLYDLQKRNNT